MRQFGKINAWDFSAAPSLVCFKLQVDNEDMLVDHGNAEALLSCR